ncbi:hypothetical protein TNCV_2908751 [Trichonephila clavipes]|nr:hypothetical protein TNCV_2908751 [Trichonephila clavipes]
MDANLLDAESMRRRHEMIKEIGSVKHLTGSGRPDVNEQLFNTFSNRFNGVLNQLVKYHVDFKYLNQILLNYEFCIEYLGCMPIKCEKGPAAKKIFNTITNNLKNPQAHFWLNGYVNKQNCRIWSEANPQVYVETPLHPEKLTVSCALWAGGILLQKR